MFGSPANGEPQKDLDGILFLSYGPGTQVFAIPVRCSSEQPSAPEALVVRPKEPSLLRKTLSVPVRRSTAQSAATCPEGPDSSGPVAAPQDRPSVAPMSALRAALRPKTALQAALERPPQAVQNRPLLPRPPKSLETPTLPPSPPPISGFPKRSSSPQQQTLRVVPVAQNPANSEMPLFESAQPCCSGNTVAFKPPSTAADQSASNSTVLVQLLALPKPEPVPPPSPPAPRFPGKREVSMFGKHDVLRYCIPGESTCYVFSYMRSNHEVDIYKCNECKKRKKHTPIKVIGDEFLTDPCLAPHDCTPLEVIKDKVDRLTYKKFQEIRRDPHYADFLSRQVWEDMLDSYDDKTLGDPEEREEMRLAFCGAGFERRRRTIARSAF
ncbi:hypothetical protein ANCCAN_08965 [Ancylostoma caninum]|uniref:Uncharacterized protein n=1 Tax=Ancylostoma caninum TaxID=29170 RepID=A0A368GKX7_ANCCA|nr:hypothetical protein ANCCAN_08965 [Ancylostoma caninum]